MTRTEQTNTNLENPCVCAYVCLYGLNERPSNIQTPPEHERGVGFPIRSQSHGNPKSTSASARNGSCSLHPFPGGGTVLAQYVSHDKSAGCAVLISEWRDAIILLR
mmetsp:Transcript_60449/g.70704  ORF Transcript_60449/g.70704 Transcript_60449/m.70704 type:complete len:106 (-) Transcript_60449:21-338(-)